MARAFALKTMSRFLKLSVSVCLGPAALLGSWPVALAHVGHGDEFQQQGDVRQVKTNAQTDALLGVITEKPQQGPDGFTVPTAAVVDADGKQLVFVKTGSTYDPVFVDAGATSGDRVTITTGLDATDDVVIQGALSLYAESKKSEQVEPASGVSVPAGRAPQATEATSSPFKPIGVGALAVGVLALGGVAASRLGRKSK